jgi:ubiquinone/menaquinone biosynthesis C-methylase UbiE
MQSSADGPIKPHLIQNRSARPKMISNPEIAQQSFWDSSWDFAGVQSFSVHTRLIEESKWKHLQHDLMGLEGWSLEVGCGSGHLSALLSQSGFRTVLLDYSPAALACARNSFRNCRGQHVRTFLHADAFALPIADSSVDVVVSGGVIEHFRDPIPAVREMARVLRPGGLFYADICPRKFSLIGLFDFLYPNPPGWYEARMSMQLIAEIIAASGLSLKRLFAAGVLPPRLVPGRGRVEWIDSLVRWSTERWKHVWAAMDGTRLAEMLGLYYYVTAIKPFDPSCVSGLQRGALSPAADR